MVTRSVSKGRTLETLRTSGTLKRTLEDVVGCLPRLHVGLPCPLRSVGKRETMVTRSVGKRETMVTRSVSKGRTLETLRTSGTLKRTLEEFLSRLPRSHVGLR